MKRGSLFSLSTRQKRATSVKLRFSIRMKEKRSELPKCSVPNSHARGSLSIEALIILLIDFFGDAVTGKLEFGNRTIEKSRKKQDCYQLSSHAFGH